MSKTPKQPSIVPLKQADLLRKLELAWLGTGTLAMAGAVVFAAMGLAGAGAAPGEESLTRGMPSSAGEKGEAKPAALAPKVEAAASGPLMRGEWVEAIDPRTRMLRVGAVTEIRGNNVHVRFCDRINSQDQGEDVVFTNGVTRLDLRQDARAARFPTYPRTAPVDMKATDFRPGEAVSVRVRSEREGRARVIGVDAQGQKVWIRWDNPRAEDEAVAPETLRLVNFGPFDRINPVPASQVPGWIPDPETSPVASYGVGQKVEVIFRGEWVPAEIFAVAGTDHYLVSTSLVQGGTLKVKWTQIRPATIGKPAMPGAVGGTEKPGGSKMVMAPTQYYRAGDIVEAQFGTSWEPAQVKRVEGLRIYLQPRVEGGEEESRSISQVRMPQELMQRRMEERTAQIRSNFNSGGGSSGNSFQPGASGNMGSQRSEPLTAADCRPGLSVTVREAGRTLGTGRVTRVVGDQVFVVLGNVGAIETARTVDQLSTSRATEAKAAGQYSVGERVYVRWGDSNVWWSNRVERVEGDRIILSRGMVNDSSEALRTLTAEEVRPMKVAEGK